MYVFYRVVNGRQPDGLFLCILCVSYDHPPNSADGMNIVLCQSRPAVVPGLMSMYSLVAAMADSERAADQPMLHHNSPIRPNEQLPSPHR